MNPTATAASVWIDIARAHGGAAVRITLRGGKGNVMRGAMLRELRAAIAAAIADAGVKVILLAGEGRHFSFGASVEEHRREQAAEMLREFHGLILDIVRCGVPIVSCVSGMCLGGAMEVALAGSVIHADATAVFGQPEITLGVFAPPASILLPLRIGYARAEELLITGENIPAQRALELGIVQHLHPTPEAMREHVDAWIATQIVPRSAVALRMAVRAERMRMVDAVASTLPRLERMYVEDLMATHDANEGIGAFLEKRIPVWTNN